MPKKSYYWVNMGASKGFLPDATSHYPNPCWFLIRGVVLWHSYKSDFTKSGPATILYKEFEKYTFNIIFALSRGHWVNHIDLETKYH